MPSSGPYVFALHHPVLEEVLKERRDAADILKGMTDKMRTLRNDPKHCDNNNCPALMQNLVWKASFGMKRKGQRKGGRFFYCQPSGSLILDVMAVIYKKDQAFLSPEEEKALSKEIQRLKINPRVQDQ